MYQGVGNIARSLRVPPPLFFEKMFLNKLFLFMWSLDRLSVGVSMGVRMKSIRAAVKFLSNIDKTLSSKNKRVEKTF